METRFAWKPRNQLFWAIICPALSALPCLACTTDRACALALGNLAAAGRVFDETAFRTPGLTGFAAQVAAVHLAACGAKRRRLRPFRDVAAAGRSFHKTAHDALVGVRLAAQFATLDLTTLGAEFDATLGLGLLAAIAAQQHAGKDHGH